MPQNHGATAAGTAVDSRLDDCTDRLFPLDALRLAHMAAEIQDSRRKFAGQ
jgi:hypothetical protein